MRKQLLGPSKAASAGDQIRTFTLTDANVQV
jgi:hypothetical protein